MNANVLTFFGGLVTLGAARWLLAGETEDVLGIGVSLQACTYVIGLLAIMWSLPGPRQLLELGLGRLRGRNSTRPSAPPQ